MIDEEIIDAPSTGESEVASSPTDLRSIIEAARDKQREISNDVSNAEPAKADEPEEKQGRKDGRDDKGRFASKDKPAEAVEVKDEQVQDQASGDEFQKPAYKAPPGWSVAAKAAFNELPETVKESIAKREQEVDKGFARYGGLKQFAEVAEENGTTLAAAVQDYAKIENSLRTNYLDGVDLLNSRFGINPAQFIMAYAARYGVDLSGTNVQQSQGYQPPAINPDALLQQAEQRFEEKFLQRETLSEIERFRNDPANAYFENVREDMAILLQNGKASDLKDAYEKACWFNPETRAILLKSQQTNHSAPNPQAAVQKAKAAAKAIGGAPSPGFNPGNKAAPANMSIREAAIAALNAQRGV